MMEMLGVFIPAMTNCLNYLPCRLHLRAEWVAVNEKVLLFSFYIISIFFTYLMEDIIIISVCVYLSISI